MSLEFKKVVKDEYQKKIIWTNIIDMLKKLNEQNQKVISNVKKTFSDIFFETRDKLIYHNDNDRLRLCVSQLLKKKVFRLTYDQNQHLKINRSYHWLTDILYISRLYRKIRAYVIHCPTCQINQTKRHIIYDELNFIFPSFISHHIIAMNFIVDLSRKYDCLLTIICKITRQLFFIFDYSIDSAVSWARKILIALQFVDWEIFIIIIFD